jgi:hypothetical protein
MYIKMDPFSEAFQETWDLWIKYLWEVMRYRYNHMSEQAALNELVDVSEGDEIHAKRIVNRSISRNWRGFYKFHNPAKDEKDGKPAKKKTTGGVTTDELRAVYIKRNGTEG